jgi:hypothetical protein
LDDLAWDLGDPFGAVEPNENRFRFVSAEETSDGEAGVGIPCADCEFHPMKGPMATQTLRGMAGAGPMHWRGDRTGAAIGGDPLDEDLAFEAFNPAFVGLLGRASELTPAEMQAFADFVLTVVLPPNPMKALTDLDTADEAAGREIFRTIASDGGVFTCAFCHRTALGTDGLAGTGTSQAMKIPHLRNLYQKVGRFGVAGGPFLGPQVRGFGFMHDGGTATIFDLLGLPVFQNLTDDDRRALEAFALAFDTGLRPVVGQQVSLTAEGLDDAGVTARLELLMGRADAGDCDLVVKTRIAGRARGFLYAGGRQFQGDRHGDPLPDAGAVRRLAAVAGQEQTYTCVPPQTGNRIALDRDRDGIWDRRELDCGTNPADPDDLPATETGTCPKEATVTVRTDTLDIGDRTGLPALPNTRRLTFRSSTRRELPANRIVPPTRGSVGDPTPDGASGGGARLVVYNAADSGEVAEIALPASGWRILGSLTAPRGYRWRSADGSEPHRIEVKNDRLTVRLGGSGFGYTLDEPAQARMALTLRLGTGATWCAAAGPRSASTDRVDRFQGAPGTPAPSVCPPMS